MPQKHVDNQPSKKDEAEVDEAPAGVEKDEKLDQITDELLAEIDEVLEENAQEFVQNYIQKGGQ